MTTVGKKDLGTHALSTNLMVKTKYNQKEQARPLPQQEWCSLHCCKILKSPKLEKAEKVHRTQIINIIDKLCTGVKIVRKWAFTTFPPPKECQTYSMEMLLTPNSSPSEGYSEILQIPCQDCRLGADMFQAETNGQRVQMK